MAGGCGMTRSVQSADNSILAPIRRPLVMEWLSRVRNKLLNLTLVIMMTVQTGCAVQYEPKHESNVLEEAYKSSWESRMPKKYGLRYWDYARDLLIEQLSPEPPVTTVRDYFFRSGGVCINTPGKDELMCNKSFLQQLKWPMPFGTSITNININYFVFLRHSNERVTEIYLIVVCESGINERCNRSS